MGGEEGGTKNRIQTQLWGELVLEKNQRLRPMSFWLLGFSNYPRSVQCNGERGELKDALASGMGGGGGVLQSKPQASHGWRGRRGVEVFEKKAR